MKRVEITRDGVLDVVKSVGISIVISLVLVSVFAILIKLFNISDQAISPINIAIKVSSLLIGCVVGIKSNKGGAIKGVIIGMFYLIISYFLFWILSGGEIVFNWIDMVSIVLVATISGIIAVNTKKN